VSKEGKKVAIKRFDDENEELKEWEIMNKFSKHKNILKAIAFVKSSSYTFLIMELASGDNAYDYLNETQCGLDEPIIKTIIKQCLLAVQISHNHDNNRIY
jgi:serine/threonine protein kinase